MRFFPAGSLLWLLWHEFRLFLRVRSGKRRWVFVIVMLLLCFMAVTAGVPLALALKGHPPVPGPQVDFIIDNVMIFLFTLLLSQTLSMTVLAFFDRGDFDLLLSSPVDPGRVLFVRCLAIALAPSILYFAILTPFVVPAAIMVDWKILASYGVMMALALSGAGGGLLLAMGLFALVGPRRTKTIGQVLSAILGAVVFLASQIPSLAPQFGKGFQGVLDRAIRSGWFDAASPLSWPARAVLGEPLPLFGFLGLSLLFFYALSRALGARFAANAAAAQGAGVRRAHGEDMRPLKRFAGGMRRAMVRKELHLMARDPALISQVLLRVLYFFPLAFILLRNARLGDGNMLLVAGSAGAVVFFVSQIAGSLAWITVSGEDAADLVTSAPVTVSEAHQAKLTAALAPVLMLAAIPIAVLAWFHPFAGLVAALGTFASALCAGLINLWYEKPQPRRNFGRRGQGAILTSLGEFALGLLLLLATTLAVSGTIWAVAPAVLAAGVLELFYFGRNKEA
jgi:ABC-2 type transport system permease protein